MTDAPTPSHARRALVVCYSLTGHTKQVAEAIAAKLGADLETIRETKARARGFSHLRGVWEVFTHATPAIAPGAHAVSDYDLVVLGCPVWASRMAAPMRSYITRERAGFKTVAFFCTEGGMGGERVLRTMSALSGHAPAAALVVNEPKLKSGAYEAQVDAFVGEIQAAGG